MERKIKLSQFVSWWTFNNSRYIFCSRSSCFAKIDRFTEGLLKTAKSIEEIEDKDLAKFCIEKGILVPEKTDEVGAFKYHMLSEQYCASPPRLSYTITVTEKCNFCCWYCFEADKMSDREMTLETAESVVSFIESAVQSSPNTKELKITWFGGEPLLNMRAISYISDRLISYCDNTDISYSASIITNGSLLSNDLIQELVKLRVSLIQVTLDGDEDISCKYKGCLAEDYQNTINGIVNAGRRLLVNVRFNTDGDNAQSILNAVDRLQTMIAQSKEPCNVNCYLACIDKPGEPILPEWYVDVHKRFLTKLKENNMDSDILFGLPKARYTSCGATSNSLLFIGIDGNIVKCEHYLGMAEHSIGTVFEGLFHNDEEARFRDSYFEPECERCSFLPICRQGCLCKRLDEKVRVNCDGFKANVENILFQLSK